MRTIIISDNGLNSECAVRETGGGERESAKKVNSTKVNSYAAPRRIYMKFKNMTVTN